MGFFPLVYEKGSKYSVTRRERASREGSLEEAGRQQWTGAGGWRCPDALGEGLRAQRVGGAGSAAVRPWP